MNFTVREGDSIPQRLLIALLRGGLCLDSFHMGDKEIN